jgi:hypothetical protein
MMTIYEFSLALGAAGLGIMAVSGFAHTVGGQHGGHAAPSNHAGHHVGAVRGAGALRGGARGGTRALWALLSPRTVFSVLLGFGVTGLLLHSLPSALMFGLAIVGGLAFELGLVRPLWNFLFRFESAPALTLETCIGDEARAATSFDAKGNGLIALELDGHLVQLLGSLRREDREAGVRVRAGDPVRIDDVDPTRNRCTVRRA